jgi:hypothetical protein
VNPTGPGEEKEMLDLSFEDDEILVAFKMKRESPGTWADVNILSRKATGPEEIDTYFRGVKAIIEKHFREKMQ